MAKQNYGGVYANMDFPTYEYHPYPRHVIIGAGGLYEVALNEEEERKIKARLKKEREETPAEIEAFIVDPDKEILISRARELNVPINRKWSKAKLESVVKQAEEAIDNLPPESDDDSLAPEDTHPDLFHVPFDSGKEDDKDALLAKAKDLGIKTQGMHLWGVPRLKATIAEFEANKE